MTKPSKPAIVPPTSNKGGGKAPFGRNPNAPLTSAALALNMSWQLLVVVVVPMVGGHMLDNHYGISLWTWVGMVLSIGGTIAVVTRTVRQLNEINGTNDNEEDKS